MRAEAGEPPARTFPAPCAPWDLRLVLWAAACLVLVAGVFLNSEAERSNWTPAGGGSPMLALLSNQSASANLPLAHVKHNRYAASILGWTNEEGLPSTNRSFDQFSTNQLLPRL